MFRIFYEFLNIFEKCKTFGSNKTELCFEKSLKILNNLKNFENLKFKEV